MTFSEIQTLVSSPASKSRISISLKDPASDSTTPDLDETHYLIRINPTPAATDKAPSVTSDKAVLTPLTPLTEDLPELIVYETSYANYPLILANGGIKRAGGQAHLSFSCITVAEDGTETRRPVSGDADVSIYLDVAELLANEKSGVKWFRTENGHVVTEGDEEMEVKSEFWKKVVARRADIGVLFEGGLVKKEVPVGLRGKGVKGKKGGKGKARERGIKELKSRSEDEDETGSD